MRIVIGLLISAIGLSACDPAADKQAQLLSEARAAVASKLLDPTSPLFSEITVRDQTVCGLVNAKNTYGGYTGGKPFVYSYGTAQLEPDPPSPLLRVEPAQAPSCMFEHKYQTCKTGVPDDGLAVCFAWMHDDVDHTPGTPVITSAVATVACLKALDAKFDSDIRPSILTAGSSQSVVNDRGTWSVEVQYNAADDAKDSGVNTKGRCEVNANGIARVAALVME